MSRILLGVDIGGTNCVVCIGNEDGQIIEEIRFLTLESEGPSRCIEKLIYSSRKLINKHQLAISAIGISCGSPLNPFSGVIQSPANLKSWIDIAIVDIFQKEFGIRTYLENDANAGALAEHRFGAGRGKKNIVFMTFGTGLGAGMILNGALYRGANVFAGEIGHFRLSEDGPEGCRKKGSFEGYCSGGGIAQLAKSIKENWTSETVLSETPTSREVGEGAAAGDELCLEILKESGRRLGQGLSYVIDLLNPELIIIGSIFARCEEYLRPSMEAVLEEECLQQTLSVCKVVPAKLHGNIGVFAALSVGCAGLED
jgi:glucokinase